MKCPDTGIDQRNSLAAVAVASMASVAYLVPITGVQVKAGSIILILALIAALWAFDGWISVIRKVASVLPFDP